MIKVTEFYKNLPKLETTHLLLRKVTLDDLHDIFTYSSDGEVTQHLRWGPHKTPEDTKAYLCEVMKEYQDGQDGPWGIEHRVTGHVIGHIHLMAIDAFHRKAQVGFVCSKDFHSTGMIPEAMREVMSYSFEIMGLNRLEGLCLVEDRWTRGVMEEVGMVKEGLLRESNFQKGAFRDFVMYALLKRDFQHHG
jgi:ribosomal-protein-alanine N-acetyltransferase